jgi:hypothetical protein
VYNWLFRTLCDAQVSEVTLGQAPSPVRARTRPAHTSAA